MVYNCTKYHENVLNGMKVYERTKGHNSVKMYVELWFLFSAHGFMMVFISTSFHENILDGNKVIERTRFS